MTCLEQQQRDADDSVVTSAPMLSGIPTAWDPEATWDGGDDEEPSDEASVPACSDAIAELCAGARAAAEEHAVRIAELEDALVGARTRAALLERRAENAEHRAMACANVISCGLAAVSIDDIFAEVERRGFQRPIPATTVVVARDDARNDVAQNASQRLGSISDS